MLERITGLKVGPGMEPGMDMGPIYSAEHRASVIEWIDEKDQRKEDVARPYLEAAEAVRAAGVVLIGIAQERASVFRPPSKRDREPGHYAVRRTSAFVRPSPEPAHRGARQVLFRCRRSRR